MGKIKDWLSVYKKNSELETLMGLDFWQDPADRAYLKKLSIDTCINFLARTISQAEFRTMHGDTIEKDDWYYKLNVRPNTDQSSTAFWQKFVYKLLFDNEVLVILSDTDDLLIADSWVRREYAVYEDMFEAVTVKSYQFKRSFAMNEVIYLNYNNEALENYIAGLFGDYGELFGRMLEVSLRNYQIRGTVEVGQLQGADDEVQSKLQKFIDKMFDAFKKPIAIVPMNKGFQYEELSSKSGETNQSFEELAKLKSSMISEVAKLIGIPPALVHGEMADLEQNMGSYVNFCVRPLQKKIEDELNAKLFEAIEYQNGYHIDISGIDKPDPIEDATRIDKAISSGFMSINEVRKEYGLEPRDGGDVYVMTKNYATTNEFEGGEDVNENGNQGNDHLE